MIPMKAKIPLDLQTLGAAKKMREGVDRASLTAEFGMSTQGLEHIASTYDGVPDALLAAIERLLKDRDKLRRLISRSF
jgi:hypothetical protein